MRSMPRSLRAAIVGTALLGCADAAPTPKGLSIAVAPLTLPSVSYTHLTLPTSDLV